MSIRIVDKDKKTEMILIFLVAFNLLKIHLLIFKTFDVL